MYLASLGSGYRLRSEAVRGRAGSDRDLDRAIEIGEASLDATPSDHSQRPTRLTLLVDAYLKRDETTGDLDRAIELGRDTVERTAGHFTLGSTLSNLGLIHQRRYARSGDQADLVEAIRLAESAVGRVPREHAARTAAMAKAVLAGRRTAGRGTGTAGGTADRVPRGGHARARHGSPEDRDEASGRGHRATPRDPSSRRRLVGSDAAAARSDRGRVRRRRGTLHGRRSGRRSASGGAGSSSEPSSTRGPTCPRSSRRNPNSRANSTTSGPGSARPRKVRAPRRPEPISRDSSGGCGKSTTKSSPGSAKCLHSNVS